MAAGGEPTTIVFALFPGITALDFVGPQQVLAGLPGTRVIAASQLGGDIVTDSGLAFTHLTRLDTVPACDVICTVGGFGLADALRESDYIGQVRRLGLTARYITSVCTGSLVLGAAGLLQGRRAACHWAWRDLLPAFGATPDPGRVVRDGDVLTGGGVTAGIDFGLVLAAELADPEAAQRLQLALEYAPEPPFDAGRPETAPPAVLNAVREAMDTRLRADRTAAVAEAAARMRTF